MSTMDPDELRDIQDLYGEIMEACMCSDAEGLDRLVALTLVLRDLSLRYHDPQVARCRSVTALDSSFAMDAPTWPEDTLH